jgi:serine/threonine protein kinase
MPFCCNIETSSHFFQCGKGAFGDVYIATHKYAASSAHRKAKWKKVAIKKTAPTVLDKRGGVRIWTYDHVEDKCQEIKSLIRLREDNLHYSCVLSLYEYYWTYNHSSGKGTLHMVTELLGQELEVWRQNQNALLESTVKKISGVILNALDYISSRNVVHRDIKLQNILFRVNGDIKTLKLVDFGLAKVIEGNYKATDFCGSLGYIAPEIYEQKPYRYEVDMFAFGIILFRLLSGVRPFSAANPEKLRSDTVNLRYKIEGRNWEGVSPSALKLVRNLLIGQLQRFTAEQAINHEWFTDNSVADSVLVPDFTMTRENVQNNDENYSQVIALVSQYLVYHFYFIISILQPHLP